jgi:endonuclease/exonuclease/phosphatase (EEP) superfamily protein YafD
MILPNAGRHVEAREKPWIFRSVRRHPRPSSWLSSAMVLLAVLPQLNLLGFGAVPVLQALVPLFCLAAAGVAAIMALRRRWLAMLVLIIGALLAILPSLVPVTATPTASSAAPLTVFSINVEFSRAEAAALEKSIMESDADVVVLVEVGEPLIKEMLSRGLRGQLPYRSPTVTSAGDAGTAILSRYPLVPEGHIPVANGIVAFDQPSVVIDHPDFGLIRVAGVHPYAPVVDGAVKWRGILRSLDSWQAQHHDIPLIMAGDFNATRAHPAFRELARSFNDAAAAAGPLPIPTWPASMPVPALLAIDHILARGLVATGWQRIWIPGTDHYGIVATVTSPERVNH